MSKSESALSMLSRVRTTMPSPDPDTISLTDKVIILELANEDQLATKLYIYYLVSRALTEPAKYDKLPQVMIFDGRYLFRDDEFISHFVADQQVLQRVKMYRAVDDSIMMMYLHSQLKANLALNLNLQLVVILVNSSILFPDLLDKINRLIFSLSISIRIVFLVDCLTKSQLEFYRQKSICDVMRCKLPEAYLNNNNNITLHITRCKSRSIVEKCIPLK